MLDACLRHGSITWMHFEVCTMFVSVKSLVDAVELSAMVIQFIGSSGTEKVNNATINI